MPRFAANLSMMFNEVPFMERFARAAANGFTGVEFLFPYDFEPEAIAAELKYRFAGGEIAGGLVHRSKRRTQIFLEANYADVRPG